MKNIKLPSIERALPGRSNAMPITNRHFINGNPLQPPFPGHLELAEFGLGCFWGAERGFWSITGVYSTAVGYSGGLTPNPTYDEICTGLTGHNEVVRVVFDPATVPFQELLKHFWESHNPTQGMRQGNDIGTQYRSGVYTYDEIQTETAIKSRQHYQTKLLDSGTGLITTEIISAPEFYYAEEYHQQYLAKNPAGYCGLGGLGISYE